MKLFEHNIQAYESAIAMLAETGKAAIIHPTGTGKSFIGFKLCEDNADKTVCWLSPSEYIYKTQLENLKATTEDVPHNIKFFTYAKLMLMSESEISDIKPDFIIFDEFHRCGAEMWGRGVKNLLKVYPKALILGLSATNIRYLDNQRNMADELFDGCIASEMTLGEAIVRGILNPPKYVLAIYSYQKDLERYQKKVAQSHNKHIRDAAEKYLEALRRALDKAEGLDVIFRKHMDNPHGKYIAFCANVEHMRTMIIESKKWFSNIDPNYHIYSVYSDDPEASQSFEGFKTDNSDHLRLLFCIDALNEGIHVEGVDGVILLRPTVSPIIYKQQIGRALSTSQSKNPIIFDIVNNISGLYSISSIEDEMREVERYYEYLGESEYIVNENFEIIDEVRECKKLFDDLEGVLSASWDYMFQEAEAYFKANGDLLPLQNYVTENGSKLGQWIVTQRINYRNKSGITPERIEKLESINMDWRNQYERHWDEGLKLARVYYEKHNRLDPDRAAYPKLSMWLSRQRQKYRENQLTEEQYRSLNSLGMTWEFEDSWEQKFAEASEYFETHGNLDIPATYVTKNGTALGAWYRGVRDRYKEGKLSKERIERLESIGMNWTSVNVRNWSAFYSLAKNYYNINGNLNINAAYKINGVKLGSWISSQRTAYKQGRLNGEQIQKLESIGMIWQRQSSKWDEAYACAEKYAKEHGNLNPPASFVANDGFALGAWVAQQRRKNASGKLDAEKAKKLEKLNIKWSPADESWNNGFQHARQYHMIYGRLNVPKAYIAADGYMLGVWIANQRVSRKSGKLTESRISLLDSIGMQWSVNKSTRTLDSQIRKYF